jgi:hypothetical protein
MSIEDLIWNYEKKVLDLKKRFYFLEAVEKLLSTLPKGAGMRNDVQLQMLNDSYSMLIIDLASLFDLLGQQRGFFEKLKAHAAMLSRANILETVQKNEHGLSDDFLRNRVTVSMEKALIRLFPKTEDLNAIVSDKDIELLRSEIQKSASDLKDDRSKLRAHRFEIPERVKANIRPVTLADVRKYFDLLEDTMNAIRLVTLSSQLTYDDMNAMNVDTAAQDIVDMLLHGTINEIFSEFGISQELSSKGSNRIFFWQFRESFHRNPPPKSDQG